MKKPGENSLINKVLTYLKETSIELLDLSMTIIFDPREITKGMGLYTQGRPLYYFPREVSNLKKSPYFNFKNNKFYLTRQGRIEIIRRIVKEKMDKKLKWDRIWRAVSFDIPELNRKERAFLRNELRWMGFIEAQKSVWVYPYDIEKELLVLLKLWKRDFEGDIRFWKIAKIVDDKDLKKRFQIR